MATTVLLFVLSGPVKAITYLVRLVLLSYKNVLALAYFKSPYYKIIIHFNKVGSNLNLYSLPVIAWFPWFHHGHFVEVGIMYVRAYLIRLTRCYISVRLVSVQCIWMSPGFS